jgi:hypothetical protein
VWRSVFTMLSVTGDAMGHPSERSDPGGCRLRLVHRVTRWQRGTSPIRVAARR